MYEDMKETKIETVTLYELPSSELHQDSGMADSVDGHPLTNLEATEQIESLLSGGKVFVSSNGALSPEAKQRNTEISRSQTMSQAEKTAAFMVSVRVQRPVDGKLHT